MSLLIRFGGLILSIGLAAHAPSMSNQFIDLTNAGTNIIALIQLGLLMIGFGFFLGGGE